MRSGWKHVVELAEKLTSRDFRPARRRSGGAGMPFALHREWAGGRCEVQRAVAPDFPFVRRPQL